MCFSPLSGFNYDQTFQFDEISRGPEPAWSFTPQFGRKAEFNSLGLSHPAPISELLMHQRRGWAIFQLIGSHSGSHSATHPTGLLKSYLKTQ